MSRQQQAALVLMLLFLVTWNVVNCQGYTVHAYRDPVASTIYGTKRTIWVHLPMTETSVYDVQPRFPVVVVPDGNGPLFHAVVAASESLGGGSGNYHFPKVIVVGLAHADRTRELTPTPTNDSSVMPLFLLAGAGGGKDFLHHLQSELFPHLREKGSAANHFTLVGHSFGGLAALQSLADGIPSIRASAAIVPRHCRPGAG